MLSLSVAALFPEPRLRLLLLPGPLFLAGTFLSACEVQPQDVPGTHVLDGTEHTRDTLRLLPNGQYRRSIHAVSGRLLYRNRDRWKYAAGDVILQEFLPEEDREHAAEAVLGLGAMACFLPVRRGLRGIEIHYSADGDGSYRKPSRSSRPGPRAFPAAATCACGPPSTCPPSAACALIRSKSPFYVRLRARQTSGKAGVIAVMRKLPLLPVEERLRL